MNRLSKEYIGRRADLAPTFRRKPVKAYRSGNDGKRVNDKVGADPDAATGREACRAAALVGSTKKSIPGNGRTSRIKVPLGFLDRACLQRIAAHRYFSAGSEEYGGNRKLKLKYLQIAVDLGSVEAPFYLAMARFRGKGTDHKRAAAMELIRLGMERGDPDCWAFHAASSYARMAGEGGGKPNPKLIRRVAVKSMAPSPDLCVALTFMRGFLGVQDHVIGAKYLRAAAKAGNAQAQRFMALFQCGRDEQKRTFWLLAAGRHGDIAAQALLGLICENKGLPKRRPNRDEAIKWHMKAALGGNWWSYDALVRLGVLSHDPVTNGPEVMG